MKRTGFKNVLRWQGLVALVVLISVLSPVFYAFAEAPTQYSEVDSAVGDDGLGQSFQHHSFYGEGRLWAFWADNSSYQIVYSSSTDGQTWETPVAVKQYSCNYSTCGKNGSTFDLWYNASNSRLDMAVANHSVNTNIEYSSGVPYANGSIGGLDTWEAAVPGYTDLLYIAPVICVNSSNNPAIAYTVFNTTAGAFDCNVSVSTASDGTWTASTADSPIGNWSQSETNVIWGSVIPVEGGNYSLQYSYESGAVWQLAQDYIGYNDGSGLYDIWGPYDVASQPIYEPLKYDSLHVQTVNNSDNVFMIWAGSKADGTGVLNFNQHGATATNWSDEETVQVGNWTPAITLRNFAHDIELSAINDSTAEAFWWNEYDWNTHTWGTALTQGITDPVDYLRIMAYYDYGDTDGNPIGALYVGTDIATDADLIDVCYGCAEDQAPADTPYDGTELLQVILPVLTAIMALIIILKQMATFGMKEMIMAVMLSGIAGGIAFMIVKAICDNL